MLSAPSRRSVRGALLVAALVLLALAFVPRADAAVYWSNGDGTTIGRADNDGTAVDEAFIGGASAPFGVASDGAHVYWGTNTAARSIGRANLDGTGVDPRFITGVRSGAVAVDAGHVYWTDLDTGSIGRANLDGTGLDPDFIPQVGAAFGVAVDGAHVYWTTFGSIGRANLDGSAADQNFMLFGIFDQPCGVAVDAAHVYWANILGTIGRANLNGIGRDENFVQAATPGDFTCGLAIDSAHLYWAHRSLDSQDVARDGIGRANLDGTGANQAFITTPQPLGVAVDAATQTAGRARISVDDVSLAEGDAGQTAFRFTVSLDRPPSAPVTVDFATANDTATAPDDYAANAGTVTFAAGETAKTVTVQVNGDTTKEGDETFNVNLANATGNAFIADATGVGTIVDDDEPVTAPVGISVDDVSLAEGDSGQTAFRFTVALDRAQSGRVNVDFATADGTATAANDYAATSGTLTFVAGETAQTVTVPVNGDTIVEPDETFSVNLAIAAGNATIADGQAVGTIVNDDRRRHRFMLGRARLNPKTGTARLPVTVPGPGTLAIAGRGVKARASGTRSVRAGTVRPLIMASGKKRRVLNQTGTVTITPRVTYTPIRGTPRTRSKTVRLQKR